MANEKPEIAHFIQLPPDCGVLPSENPTPETLISLGLKSDSVLVPFQHSEMGAGFIDFTDLAASIKKRLTVSSVPLSRVREITERNPKSLIIKLIFMDGMVELTNVVVDECGDIVQFTVTRGQVYSASTIYAPEDLNQFKLYEAEMDHYQKIPLISEDNQ